MIFKDFRYCRPNIEEIKKDVLTLIDNMKIAKTKEEQSVAIEKINKIRSTFSTMANLVYIRASINTNDEFYQKERDYMDEIEPEMDEIITEYYKVLVKSPFSEQLETEWGSQLFALADNQIKSFSPKVMDLMQQENKLVSKYSKLVASAQIEFNGEVLTIAQLGPYVESTDRIVRKQAREASADFYAENAAELDRLYDELVKIRHEMATRLGFKNYVELAYILMNRIDYDAKMVANFRKQVAEYIVPVVTKLYERQANRIGVEKFKFYDESFNFQTGNAKPKGDANWILANGKKMYEELSKETKQFIHDLLDRELLDVEAKKGKESGGYCTFIEDYAAPFIFSNFNGTSGDIDVLTHEAGHAFQVYTTNRKLAVPDYLWPTYESCEIHSMSMEFFTWPWMELFFKEDTDKYKYSHLSSGLIFLPYGVAVDEFQHIVYENPKMTPSERNEAWRKLEQKYLPHRDYDGHPYLESGGMWQRQLHIYTSPFYYIDYTLAQICAFQFWKRSREDFNAAWKDYLHICEIGGSLPFNAIVKEAGLISPFEDGCVKAVIDEIEQYLNSIDDNNL